MIATRAEADDQGFNNCWCNFCDRRIEYEDFPILVYPAMDHRGLVLHKNCAVAMAAKILNEFESIRNLPIAQSLATE